MSLFFFLLFQGVDAGPAAVSCGGAPVTLTATPYDLGMPAPEYSILWDGAGEAYEHFVVTPLETTTYSVTLTVGINTYQDSVTVFVHPGDPDLTLDGMYNADDWNAFFAAWQGPVDGEANLDPDQNGQVNILDWFFFAILTKIPLTPLQV